MDKRRGKKQTNQNLGRKVGSDASRNKKTEKLQHFPGNREGHTHTQDCTVEEAKPKSLKLATLADFQGLHNKEKRQSCKLSG